MATGDSAAAAGLPVVPSTKDIRLGYDDINKLADALAAHLVSGGHAWNKISGRPVFWHTMTTGVAIGLGGTTRTVTFPTGRFSSPPVIQLTLGNQTQSSNLIRIAVGAATATGFEYTIRNDATTSQTCTVYISAFQEG